MTIAWPAAIAAAFVLGAILLRGGLIANPLALNPDEAELLAQARAAMRNPVPFTTWTTATTGPVIPLFLALLGAEGAPLTFRFAHLLAAFLLGVLGYLGFCLARRALGPATAAVVTLFWWLPIVLVLAGDPNDFGGLNTELLPCVFILGAALVPTGALDRRPVLYVTVGLLSGLSVGGKYQLAPLALAVLLVKLMLAERRGWRVVGRAISWWVAGAAAPFVVVGLAMLLSSQVSADALRVHLGFLTSYQSSWTLAERVRFWGGLVLRTHVVLLMAAVLWLGVRSTPQVRLARAVVVVSGLYAVYAGGFPFAHYLYVLYAAIAIAIGLSLRPRAAVVPVVRRPAATVAVVAALALLGWLVSFGPTVGRLDLTGPKTLSSALSADSGQRVPSLAAACPPSSTVLVWGWSPDLYVNYSWVNAFPFLNVSQVILAENRRASGYQLLRDAIEAPSTDCVIDAVGQPFYGMDAEQSLLRRYPELAPVLSGRYDKAAGAVDCTDCTVYVRRRTG